MIGLAIVVLSIWLACEICARDYNQPPPPDPYRRDRWRDGEGV